MKIADCQQFVEDLSDLSLPKNEWDRRQAVVKDRIREVWDYICLVSHRTIYPETELPEFSIKKDLVLVPPDVYTDFISSDNGSSYETADNKFYHYKNSFPIELLWDERWQSTIDNHILEADRLFQEFRAEVRAKNKSKKERQKENAHKRYERRQLILSKVKSVLTDEEFDWLKGLIN